MILLWITKLLVKFMHISIAPELVCETVKVFCFISDFVIKSHLPGGSKSQADEGSVGVRRLESGVGGEVVVLEKELVMVAQFFHGSFLLDLKFLGEKFFVEICRLWSLWLGRGGRRGG